MNHNFVMTILIFMTEQKKKNLNVWLHKQKTLRNKMIKELRKINNRIYLTINLYA